MRRRSFENLLNITPHDVQHMLTCYKKCAAIICGDKLEAFVQIGGRNDENFWHFFFHVCTTSYQLRWCCCWFLLSLCIYVVVVVVSSFFVSPSNFRSSCGLIKRLTPAPPRDRRKKRFLLVRSSQNLVFWGLVLFERM